jgi:NTE family protein
MKQPVGLVLTGGSARGAYQAGVLVGISELMPTRQDLFPIITGISAGTINTAA